MNFVSKIKENRIEHFKQVLREYMQERGVECEIEYSIEYSNVILKCQTPRDKNICAYTIVTLLSNTKRMFSLKWFVMLDDFLVSSGASTREVIQWAKGNIDIGNNFSRSKSS